MGNLRVCVAAAIVVSACGPSGSVLDFDAGADGGRIDAPDKCPPTPPPMCDVFLSCGCAPGQKCTSAQVGLGCMNAGSKQVGQDCANDTECAPGTVCLLYGGTTTCLQYCDVLHECKQGNTACYVGVNDREVPPVVVATVCGPTCSLLDQDCHIVGQACYPSPDVYPVAERGTCRPSGAGVQGDACTGSSMCAAGYLCVKPSNSTTAICAKMCDRLDGVPGCGTGTSCMHLSDNTQTGICLPPP
ncbi:MAG TPA: hypothetical protein VKE22_06030 [Haliangiales bacterium]|nr:hypothetical protein [Haliangiales bacterium]